MSGVNRVMHVAPESLLFRLLSQNEQIDYVPCAKFGEGYEDEYPPGTLDIDITNIAFDRDAFDVILCSHVLEHIPDDRKAMSELCRVLAPTGWAILQVPLDPSLEKTYEDPGITDPAEREKAFGQRDHVRVYGRDYEARLEKAGFNVQKIECSARFSDDKIFYYGLDKNESIFLCTKS